MSLNIDSVNAKLARAEEHRDALERELATWGHDNPYELLREVNAEFTRFSVRLRIKRSPDLVRWGLLFGDCIHNLRCALDHLAHAIARHELRGQVPDDVAYNLQFVLARDPSEFARQMKSKRANVLSQPVRTAIEQVQPYKRPHPSVPPLLALLRDLNNTDKHSLIRPALHAATPRATRFSRPIAADEKPVDGDVVSGVVEDGAEVLWISLAKPARDFHIELDTSISVCIRHSLGPKPPDMTIITDLAGALVEEVRQVIGIVSARVV